jgi:hypothetical protein
MNDLKSKINQDKFNELVEIISLSHTHIISGVPNEQLSNLKQDLESKKELSDYTFVYEAPNVLVANKNYGVRQNA